jgi:hypothetical protein
VGITPRTKARKRLRGEEVEDTPRPRGRGSRGSSGAKGFFGSDGLGRGRSDNEDDDRAGDEDEDEVLGPTPKKGELGRRGNFKTLFGVDEEEDSDLDNDVELGSEKNQGRWEIRSQVRQAEWERCSRNARSRLGKGPQEQRT